MIEIQHTDNTFLVLQRAPYHIQQVKSGMVTAMPDDMQYEIFSSYEDAKTFILTLDPEWVDPLEGVE